jgi:glycerol-3-phosphate dehydrogenase
MRRNLVSLKGRKFDVLVCGGGIYGAWTAYDAALRGLSVAIVEQGDWASATSSASSKLIHGGLRYLETLDIGLVRKALQERRMLLKMAPHRIWPLRFAVPVYKRNRVGKFRLKLGLTLYDYLAGSATEIKRHRSFDKDEFSQRFSFLKDEYLVGGLDYGDAQTDDARLVLEIIDGASSAGAVCVNYCKVSQFIENNGEICGAEVQDQISQETFNVQANQVVNACGQWLGDCLEQQQWHRLSKGVHLVLPKLLGDEALLLTAQSDGRVFFMIPWYDLTLVGTTDTDYKGDINRVIVEQEDIDYLLAEVNRVLKQTHWTTKDIIGQFAGLRVLKSADNKAVTNVSRDWELKTLDSGLLVSIGGKITSARKDAAHIVDTVCNNLGATIPCKTQDRAFPWAPKENYAAWFVTTQADAERQGIDRTSALWLLRRHGERVSEVFRLLDKDPDLSDRITPSLPLIWADLLFCAENEMVVNLEDLLRRRLPILITARLTRKELTHLGHIANRVLGWNEAFLKREIQRCEEKWCRL